MTQSSLPLSGRHALVTGASKGIGAAVAKALAAQGATLSLIGRQAENLQAVAAACGGAARAMAVDVTDSAAFRRSIGAAAAASGAVDILINNAGAAASEPLHKASDAVWQQMLAVNLTAAFVALREVLPSMLANQFGRIVNVASTAGLTGYAYTAAYCAAKHGLVGLTRAAARETARHDITINAVCPGFTDTDIAGEAIANISAKTGRTAEQARAALTATNPQGRLVRPDEVANAVLWLCLPGSESITGQSIVVAGGELM
jgi:NAD(P)-dependent dehydrogenase (short-subunit alcohol dehydrogenase family)